MVSWGEELEKQHRTHELEHPATSTLAKRPASSSRQKADANEPPSKRAKTGGGGVDDVKQHYADGSLNKVRNVLLLGIAGGSSRFGVVVVSGCFVMQIFGITNVILHCNRLL